MHYHEFEHINGLITEIQAKNKIEIDNITLVPVKIIDGKSLSYNEESINYSFFEKTYYLLEESLELFDYNKILDFKVIKYKTKEKILEIIEPIENYLRRGNKYSTVQMSAGPYGCIPIASTSSFTRPKLKRDKNGDLYLVFEEAGIKNKIGGKEKKVTLYVKLESEDDKILEDLERCLKNKKFFQGAINGKNKNKRRAHSKNKLDIDGKKKKRWRINSKYVVISCSKKKK
ncbi:MAG: hypothetical protein HKN68_18220 [Saprospiraceae bacterium]|nr:hypothetical protein [Saprospiraceae bacterium]